MRIEKHRCGAGRIGFALFALLAVLWSAPSPAAIDPDFTPVHVEKGADLVCTVTVAEVDAGKGATLAVADVIKGRPPAEKLRLDFAGALARQDGAAAVKELVALLRSNGDAPALFASGGLKGAQRAFLHVRGLWLWLGVAKQPDTVLFERIDTEELNRTFNGGTDMLIGTMRFISKYPGIPIMAASGGTEWSGDPTKVGVAHGKVSALIPVDADGDGHLDVFAACAKGDRLWLSKGNRAFDEAKTPASASLAAAWADFDADGRPDLASLSENGLTLYLQQKPGQFTPKKLEALPPVQTGSPTLDVVDFNGDGRPDLVAGVGRPVVLRNDGAEFRAVELPKLAVDRAPGAPGPCVIADFDADGCADILQTFQRAGALYRAKPDGSSELRLEPAAAMGDVKARRACVGDFDHDGRPDVILIGGGATPRWLQNRSASAPAAGAFFEEVSRLTGEPSYIIQPGAAAIAAGDFNNDSFLDLFVCYDKEPPKAFFNRGFRSFGVWEALDLKPEYVDGGHDGQTAATWVDLDSSGSDDLLVALASGAVYFCETKVGEIEAPLSIRVRVSPRSAWAGPLLLRFSAKDRAMGARITRRHAAPATIGVPEPGAYTLTFRGPDGKEHTKKVVVEKGPVEIVIGDGT